MSSENTTVPGYMVSRMTDSNLTDVVSSVTDISTALYRVISDGTIMISSALLVLAYASQPSGNARFSLKNLVDFFGETRRMMADLDGSSR